MEKNGLEPLLTPLRFRRPRPDLRQEEPVPRRLLVLPSLALLLPLAACGGDATEATTPAAAPSSAASAAQGASPSASPSASPRASSAPSGKGTPVVAASPAPTAIPTKPEPARGASSVEQIGYALEKQAVKTARVAAATSSSCAGPVNAPGEVACTVDYAGIQVPFTVTIKSAGTVVSSYSAATTKGVLVKEAVLTSVGSNGGFPNWIDTRCDMPQDKMLVTLDEPSGVTCTYKLKSDPDKVVTVDVRLTRFDISLRQKQS